MKPGTKKNKKTKIFFVQYEYGLFLNTVIARSPSEAFKHVSGVLCLYRIGKYD